MTATTSSIKIFSSGCDTRHQEIMKLASDSLQIVLYVVEMIAKIKTSQEHNPIHLNHATQAKLFNFNPDPFYPHNITVEM